MINKKTTSENRRILQIAVPSIISNITVPLLGLIDVTIVGHLGLSGIYRGDCRRRNVVQYHLLDLRIPTYGNKRHDLTSLRAA